MSTINILLLHRFRSLESGFFFKKELIMQLNSIIRASFRRSSLALHKNLQLLPSLPTKVILLGCCSDLITSTSGITSIYSKLIKTFPFGRVILLAIVTISPGKGSKASPFLINSGKRGNRLLSLGTVNTKPSKFSTCFNLGISFKLSVDCALSPTGCLDTLCKKFLKYVACCDDVKLDEYLQALFYFLTSITRGITVFCLFA